VPVTRLSPLVCAACAALAVAGPVAAATPVPGSVFGPVTAVAGSTFKVATSQSPTGFSTVSVSPATSIVEEVAGARSDLKNGVCVTATGTKGAKGAVAAVRVTVTQPVKGACGNGFGGSGGTGRRGPRPAGNGGHRPPGGASGFGFAAGKISAVKGDTLTVHGKTASTTVTVSVKTQVLVQREVTRAAISVKSCASVRGTSSNGGVTVTAQRVELSKPTATGCAVPRRP